MSSEIFLGIWEVQWQVEKSSHPTIRIPVIFSINQSIIWSIKHFLKKGKNADNMFREPDSKTPMKDQEKQQSLPIRNH